MDESPEASGPQRSTSAWTRRLWAVLAAAAVVGFVLVVVSSTRKAAVPVGASGDVNGMRMQGMTGGAGMRMSMRDIYGHVVRVPDGRAGIAVFIEPRNCAPCVDAVRAASRAARGARPVPELLVVSVDSATTRSEVAAFARTSGVPRARYVVDDRSGSLASMFTASGLGTAVVYDSSGKIVAHLASAAEIKLALRAAAR